MLNAIGDALKDLKDPPTAPKVESGECPVITPFVKDAPSGNAESSEDLREVLKEIVYWQQPYISGKVFLALGFFYYATLEGGYEPVNLVVYALILRLISVSGTHKL